MNSFDLIRVLCNTSPKAYALITGATVTGTMLAYSFEEGTIVVVEAQGLPATGCGLGVHGLHIHEGSSCSGTPENPFGNAGGHYSTTNCPHPYHTGDLPPLFSEDGQAWMAVYISKFTPEQIVGRLFHCHPVPWLLGRFPWPICGIYWAPLVRAPFFPVLLRRASGDGACSGAERDLAAVLFLWLHWWYWTGRGVYHAGGNAGEMVPQAAGICDRACHYGLWLCGASCRACHAVPGGSLWIGREFPDHGRCVCCGYGGLCAVPGSAPRGRGRGAGRGDPAR